MSELIIPAGVKADYRPYRTATTAALLYELQQRQVIGELHGQIMMPDSEVLNGGEDTKNAIRVQQFQSMASQMGVQIAQSGFALAEVGQQPNVMDPEKNDEILSLSILVARHPRLPPVEVQTPTAPALINP